MELMFSLRCSMSAFDDFCKSLRSRGRGSYKSFLSHASVEAEQKMKQLWAEVWAASTRIPGWQPGLHLVALCSEREGRHFTRTSMEPKCVPVKSGTGAPYMHPVTRSRVARGLHTCTLSPGQEWHGGSIHAPCHPVKSGTGAPYMHPVKKKECTVGIQVKTSDDEEEFQSTRSWPRRLEETVKDSGYKRHEQPSCTGCCHGNTG